MPAVNPEFQFDDTRATPRFPIPVVKYALLVPVADGYPTHIKPEWDQDGTSPQVFIGSWYAMVDRTEGRVRYGSAQDQWENMHTRVNPGERHPEGGWVKTLVPVGYHVDQALDLVTMIPDPSMPQGFAETRKAINPGTLVLRQPGGEIQHVRPADEVSTYFSSAQSEHIGLDRLPIEEFSAWAVQSCVTDEQLSLAVGQDSVLDLFSPITQ